MIKQVHNIFKGLKAQNLAALSLFLQCLSEEGFEYIHLESNKGEDFDLVFKDGHKIICESKARQSSFGFSDLRHLLTTINKKRAVSENDQVLVICTNVSKTLEDMLSHVKYYMNPFIEEFTNKGFSQNLIALLPKVRIWRVTPQRNEEMIYALLDELFQVVLPPNRMNELISHILWNKIFCKSASGSKYSKQEFYSYLNQFKQQLIRGGILDSEIRRYEDILQDLLKALKDDSNYVWREEVISQLSAQPDLLYYVFDIIEKKKLQYKDLGKWSKLWDLNKISHFSLRIFRIFSSNLHTAKNRKYVLKYVKTHISNLRRFYRLDYFIVGASDILEKILDADCSLAKESFALIKELFINIEPASLFITKRQDLRYERDKISSLLMCCYNNASTSLQDRIYYYILETFDLISEVGSSDIHTPYRLYPLVKVHLQSKSKTVGFQKQFLRLVRAFVKQYERDLKRFGMTFNGWETAGSTGAFWGGNYSVSDRKFVEVILMPALAEHYERKPDEAWQFIKEYCIAPEKKVSKRSPDFLNRATIPIVLKRYGSINNNISTEAFKYLKEFILSKGGIPDKRELIYQSVRGSDLSDEQKWELVQVSLIANDNLPVTPFVEQIVTELAKKSHVEARAALEGWFSNPVYFKEYRIVDNVIPNIEAFLESDLTLAILLFEQFISNKAFINKKDEFDTYDAAVLLQKIMERDYAKGLDILKRLIQVEKPTINQQILISHAFYHRRNPNDKEDPSVLMRILKNYVMPNLKKFSDYNYLTHSHSRASFVQFADKLAISELINEALIIVKAFMSDPDPFPPGKDPGDPEAKYSEQKGIEEGKEPITITSVRGHCAWTLARCPAIPSRKNIPEIIDLTKQLLNDSDWYIKHMASFSLSNLAQNRLSVMPPEKKELFLDLNKNKLEALKLAKDIEAMAFKFLEEVSKASANVQTAIAKSAVSPFKHIRALNQEDADRFLKITMVGALPLQKQAAPFLIYLAEFRENASSYQDWPWQAPEYYDDLQEFDNTHFKKVLEIWTVNGPTEIRETLAWEYWALIQEAYRDQFDEHFPIALKYLNLATQKYEHRVFENIYSFIDDCIDVRFEECFSLWKKCLETEKAFFDKDFDPYKMHWWPHHYNGRILLKMKEKAGDEEFVKWLKFLSLYPEGARLEDLRIAVEALVNLSKKHNKAIKDIFNNLINKRKEVHYCDLKEAWEKKV